MEYCDLRPAVEAFREGRNVMEELRRLLGVDANDDRIVEIAYDLQAGSYAQYVTANPDYWTAYSRELAQILSEFVHPGDTILDVGTGEMTTLAGVMLAGLPQGCRMFGCDISFSRIRTGRDFLASTLSTEALSRVDSFCGNLFHLPLLESSVDVVWTSHALEPNGGKELEAVSELLRVARRYVVLFEPSYEHNSAEGKQRMERLGYVRDLPGAVARAGGVVVAARALPVTSNPLNPTWALICRKDAGATGEKGMWACPSTRLPMERHADCFFSPASRLAYPIIDGIPILRREQAILASALG